MKLILEELKSLWFVLIGIGILFVGFTMSDAWFKFIDKIWKRN